MIGSCGLKEFIKRSAAEPRPSQGAMWDRADLSSPNGICYLNYGRPGSPRTSPCSNQPRRLLTGRSQVRSKNPMLGLSSPQRARTFSRSGSKAISWSIRARRFRCWYANAMSSRRGQQGQDPAPSRSHRPSFGPPTRTPSSTPTSSWSRCRSSPTSANSAHQR